MPRSRLGPLAIETKLGDHPSQSCVWRAVHVQLKKAVAVKVFAVPFGGTPQAKSAFAAEWERLKKIQHPAIARCYGGGFEETDAYLAHELIEGETLSANLERRGRMSWESVLDFAEAITVALEYLHQNDIVHGRIGPDKIMFAGLSPVLIDVRVDRMTSSFRNNRPPTAAEVALQAPELIGDPNDLRPPADLYALGATMYLALTGRSPAVGDTIEDVAAAVTSVMPPSPASLVMDCPVWLDKLVMQLLNKQPAARPPNAGAVKLALAEVRRRAMSRSGVAEHASSGFSPLAVTNQRDRDVARALLGRDAIDLEEKDSHAGAIDWHDQPWLLIGGLIAVIGLFAWAIWPLSEDQMRTRAEGLLVQQSRTAMNQAKSSYLEPMLRKFPDGDHTDWVKEQIDRVDMLQAEHALEVKLKRNLPLQNEGERLYAEASQYERFGDAATALDRYRSMQTLLADEEQYRPFVNLARRQIARIQYEGIDANEAVKMIQSKLAQADELQQSGKVVAARQIWYSIVELYGNNDNVAPLVEQAQSKLSGDMPNETESATP